MRKTLAEIAGIVDGEVVGDPNVVITGLCGIESAQKGDLTFLANPKYLPLVYKTRASAVLISRGDDIREKPAIRTDNPSLAFTELLTSVIEKQPLPFSGVHKSAYLGKGAVIGHGASIGPYAVIERDAAIGDDSVIYGGCYVGHRTVVGRNCLIYPNTTLREQVTIGNNVIIHSGTVIGSDGFGYVQVDGYHKKIPQVGTVVIEDDVEIGANVTIDRARFDQTFIGRGTKIDNLVQIAHNVVMGEHCIIVSQVGISGSVKIGKGVVLAGQAGVVGHIAIGDGTIVMAQSSVAKSVPARQTVSGSPARPHRDAKRVFAYSQKLGQYVKKIQELERRIKSLESKSSAKKTGKSK